MQQGRKPHPSTHIEQALLVEQCSGREGPVGAAAVMRGESLLFGSPYVRRTKGRVLVYPADFATDEVARQLQHLDAIEPEHGLAWEARAANALSAAGLPLTAISRVLGLASHAEAQRRVALARRGIAIERFRRVRAGHLRYLSAMSNEQFSTWCKRIQDEALTVLQLRDAIAGHSSPTATNASNADLDAYAQRVSARLGAPVRFVWPQDPGKRAIEITWYTTQDLKGVFERLANTEELSSEQEDPRAKVLRIAVRSADDVASILGGE